VEQAFLFALGVVILLAGGESLVRGASALARHLGVSPLAVGLTVVALGTSSPELAVNLSAALRGNTAISFGNVLGSNLANLGLVIGSIALLQPLRIETVVVRREIPMMLLATGVAMVLGLDSLLNGPPDVYTRGDCLALLLVFCVFVYYITGDIRAQRHDRYLEHVAVRGGAKRQSSRWAPQLALVAVGVVGLVAGASLTVQGATGLARSWGISDALIGLTLVAVGTSLPELAASLVAAFRGEVDLAVGNVVGSNVLNLLLVLGLTGTVQPIPVPEGGGGDLMVCAVFSVLLLAVSSTYGGRIVRWEGGLLLVGYLVYVVQRVAFFG
jgi:cation:H+ antiporter